MLASVLCFTNFKMFPNLEAARGAMIVLFMSTGGSLAGCRDYRIMDEIMDAKSSEELVKIFEENFAFTASCSDGYDNVLIYQKKHDPEKLLQTFQYLNPQLVK